MEGRDRTTLLNNNEIEAIKICQGIINRMAENSARTKNFFFVLTAAFLTLIGADTICGSVILIGGYVVIALAMWYTDARYLQLEQMFRGVHNRIVNGCQPNLDSWMFKPQAKDAKSMWWLMFRNFSTLVYPAVAIVVVLLACA
ncbi:MAG: hypothetical protein IJ164_04295 [Duodenibacillus sp.]|nr:hypothetical protein [Duodenibacillus sp.]